MIKIDNQPTALNFVESESKASPYFNIKYEEKTKTIISIACDDLVIEFENVKDSQTYLEKVTSMITDYYEKQLNMSKDEYYCVVGISIITETPKNLYAASIHIGCGLIQSGDKIMYEENVFIIKDTD